jgi:hypothetical protein
MAQGIQGVRGSYNSGTSRGILQDLRRFQKQWIRSTVQELRYSEKEMRRWQQFAGK